MEIHPVGVAEKRIYPAINVNRSGTRREELLLPQKSSENMDIAKTALLSMDEMDTMSLLDKLKLQKTMLISLIRCSVYKNC